MANEGVQHLSKQNATVLFYPIFVTRMDRQSKEDMIEPYLPSL